MTQRGRSLGSGRLAKRERARGGPIWVLDWKGHDGSRHRENLGTDRKLAERRQAEIIRERDMQASGLGHIAGQDRMLSELRTLYLADLKSRACAAHASNASARLERMLKKIAARRVRDLRGHDVLRVRSLLLGSGMGVTTANMHVGVVSAMLTWAVSVSLIADNPIRNLKRLPENEATKRHRRRALSDDEIARFLAAVEQEDRHYGDWEGPKRTPQAPLFRTFLETGARYNELARLTWHDVDLDRALILLRAENTKSRKARAIPLRGEMVEVLRTLPRTNARVFLTPEGCPWGRSTRNLMRIFDRVLRRAEIPRVDARGLKVDIHALRGTCATRLARSGVGLVQAQRILGHASPRLTAQAYVHMEIDDLRAAVERVPSLLVPSGADSLRAS